MIQISHAIPESWLIEPAARERDEAEKCGRLTQVYLTACIELICCFTFPWVIPFPTETRTWNQLQLLFSRIIGITEELLLLFMKLDSLLE